MNDHELIMELLKKQIMDLTYYEKMRQWSPANWTDLIHETCISIKTICDAMNLIGPSKFWIHEKGIQGWDGVWVDVRKRFGLFEGQ